MPLCGMPGACRNGIVKNQQGSAAVCCELGRVKKQHFRISHNPVRYCVSGNSKLPDFSQSRERSSGGKLPRSARLAQTAKQFAGSRRRRRSAGEARRQTRVSKRYREKSAGFGSGMLRVGAGESMLQM
jgi:hypothetical protein